MITDDPIYVAMTAATIAVPASSDGAHAAGQYLIGIGLFIAEYDRKGRWRFARRAHAIPAGEPESELLAWVADRLPSKAMLIGWDVDRTLVPALLDAAATAPSLVAHRFTGGFHRLLCGGVVDMALGRGGTGTPLLAAVASEQAIYAPNWNPDAITGAWAVGEVDQLRRDLADEALALWRVFVRPAGAAGIEAEAQTDAWVTGRQQLRLVGRAAARIEQQEQGE